MTRRPKNIETEHGIFPAFTDLEFAAINAIAKFAADGTYMANWANKLNDTDEIDVDASAFFKLVSRLLKMGLVIETDQVDKSLRGKKRVYRRLTALGELALEANKANQISAYAHRAVGRPVSASEAP